MNIIQNHVCLRFSILISTLLTLISCSHLTQENISLKEQLGRVTPIYDQKDFNQSLSSHNRLPRPFKMAIYLKSAAPQPFRSNLWKWSEQDKSIIQELVTNLKTQKIINDHIILDNSFVEDDSLRSLRLLASKQNAHALLIINGAGQIERYINNWGWSYFLFLPHFFVKGSVAESHFLINSSLWDVKNEFLYFSTDSETTTKENYIAAFGKQDKDLLNPPKTKSLMKAKTDITNKFSQVIK